MKRILPFDSLGLPRFASSSIFVVRWETRFGFANDSQSIPRAFRCLVVFLSSLFDHIGKAFGSFFPHLLLRSLWGRQHVYYMLHVPRALGRCPRDLEHVLRHCRYLWSQFSLFGLEKLPQRHTRGTIYLLPRETLMFQSITALPTWEALPL